MTLPNFLIIGAAKSGTTALFQYLEQHPEVFLSDPKEPHFLALEGTQLNFRGPGDDHMMNSRAVTQLDRYAPLFAKAGNKRAIGEGSVSTLYYPESIGRIQKYLPGVKIICMLRQPADRAFSAFSYMQMRAYEPLDSFEEALRQEPERIAQGWHHIWHYRRMGLYYEQVKRFLDAFGKDRVRIYLFDDFKTNPRTILRDCFDFLDIDPNFEPTKEPAPLVSGKPKSQLLQKVVNRATSLRKMLKLLLPSPLRDKMRKKFDQINLQREKLEPQLRAELTASFRDDMLQLQDLINRDLAAWLKA